MDPGMDILQSRAQVLTNTVNCDGYMGKGLAKLFKSKYTGTDLFTFYQSKCQSGELTVGKPCLWHSNEIKMKSVLLFPTKNHYQFGSKIIWIEEGLDYLRDNCHTMGIESIAIPALGCSNGGLDWDSVKKLIVEKLQDKDDLFVELYPPKKQNTNQQQKLI